MHAGASGIDVGGSDINLRAAGIDEIAASIDAIEADIDDVRTGIALRAIGIDEIPPIVHARVTWFACRGMMIRVMVHGLFRYRSFIWSNALAELRHRYAGTNLGIVWNVIHPLALIAVYAIVFTHVFRETGLQREIVGVGPRFSFLLYLTSALLPWLAFAECVTRGANAFAENAAYLKKLPVPEQVFVAQSAAAATLGLLISFSLLLVVSLLTGLRPTVYWLLLPLPLLSFQVMGFGLGLLCGTLNVFFRDIGQLVGVSLQLLLWTVPVVYAKEILPNWAETLLPWHPLYPPIAGIRELFLYQSIPSPALWIGMIAWPIAACGLAWMAFSALRTEIRDLL